MRYFLIKNCKLVERQNQINDILIANNKIIAIGNEFIRPTIGTETIDANGHLAIPGLINICSNFLSLKDTEELRRQIHNDVAAGFTTWIGFENASQMNETLQRLNKQELRTLNYSVHFDADQFKHGDLNKMKALSTIHGIPSMRYTINEETAYSDRIEIYLTTAAKNGMLIIFDISSNQTTKERIDELKIICEKISNVKCKTLFTNILSIEEVDIISQLRTTCTAYAQISVPPIANVSDNNFTPITQQYMGTLLRENDWICADIKATANTKREQVVQIFDLCKRNNISEEEMIEFFIRRKCKFAGLSPEKGEIKIGSDADICIINNGVIEQVVQNGFLTYNNGIIHNNISGKQIYRRIM